MFELKHVGTEQGRVKRTRCIGFGFGAKKEINFSFQNPSPELKKERKHYLQIKGLE